MNTNKPTVRKQILGAVVGSALAVGLYYTYTFAAPVVTGFILSPENYPNFFGGEATSISNTQLNDENRERVEQRVQKVITFTNTTDEPMHNGAPEVYREPVYQPYQVPVQGNVTYGPDRIIAEEITTTTTETITESIKHVEQLPDSGVHTYAMIVGALMGAFGLRALKKGSA